MIMVFCKALLAWVLFFLTSGSQPIDQSNIFLSSLNRDFFSGNNLGFLKGQSYNPGLIITMRKKIWKWHNLYLFQWLNVCSAYLELKMKYFY